MYLCSGLQDIAQCSRMITTGDIPAAVKAADRALAEDPLEHYLVDTPVN
jgi:hypothetical protein